MQTCIYLTKWGKIFFFYQNQMPFSSTMTKIQTLFNWPKSSGSIFHFNHFFFLKHFFYLVSHSECFQHLKRKKYIHHHLKRRAENICKKLFNDNYVKEVVFTHEKEQCRYCSWRGKKVVWFFFLLSLEKSEKIAFSRESFILH